MAAIFAASWRAVGAREIAREERERQRRVCQELYQKVGETRVVAVRE